MTGMDILRESIKILMTFMNCQLEIGKKMVNTNNTKEKIWISEP